MMENNLLFMFFFKRFLNRLPYLVIQKFLDFALLKMKKKHPRVFMKIAQHGDVSFLINPTDLNFNFYLVINKNNSASLTVEPKSLQRSADATIKATLFNLIKLFEGQLDGDAAFFSKDLIIEGSTAAVVSLRNALDSENINIIKDLTDDPRWYNMGLKKSMLWCYRKGMNLNQFFNDLHRTLVQSLDEKINDHSQLISTLKQELYDLKAILFKK